MYLVFVDQCQTVVQPDPQQFVGLHSSDGVDPLFLTAGYLFYLS
jgi:hypothetical protein